MKKTIHFTLISLLLLTVAANSQPDLNDAVSKEMCNCLSEPSKAKGFDFVDIKACMKTAMEKNIPAIQTEIRKIYGNSATYEQGEEIGRRLAKHVDTGMVYSCDAYFRAIDSLRFLFTAPYKIDSLRKVFLKYQNAPTQPSKAFYAERAKLNFLLGHYKESLSDMGFAFKNEENPQMIIEGLALDRSGAYREAAATFYKLASLTGEQAYLVHAAIENRKAQSPK